MARLLVLVGTAGHELGRNKLREVEWVNTPDAKFRAASNPPLPVLPGLTAEDLKEIKLATPR